MGILPQLDGNLPPELRLDGTLPPDAQGFWLREQFERGALRDPVLIQALLEQARLAPHCARRAHYAAVRTVLQCSSYSL